MSRDDTTQPADYAQNQLSNIQEFNYHSSSHLNGLQDNRQSSTHLDPLDESLRDPNIRI